MGKKQNNYDLPATKRDLEKLVTKKEFREAIVGLATKEELKNLATKEELKKLATKEELKKLATKEELKKLATKEELVQLEKILKAEIRLTAEETKKEIGDKIKKANNRVLNVLDAFLKELDTSRQERAIVTHQTAEDREKLENHEKRITFLEQKIAPA